MAETKLLIDFRDGCWNCGARTRCKQLQYSPKNLTTAAVTIMQKQYNQDYHSD
jgi:hypothetical protein